MMVMLGLRVGLPRTAAEGTLPGGKAASLGVTNSKAVADLAAANRTAKHTDKRPMALARRVISTVGALVHLRRKRGRQWGPQQNLLWTLAWLRTRIRARRATPTSVLVSRRSAVVGDPPPQQLFPWAFSQALTPLAHPKDGPEGCATL
jgi:hypothetical protein